MEKELAPEGGIGKWTEEDLRRYLLALSYGEKRKRYELDRKKFPKSIQLSGSFHSALDQLRALTAKDGFEYWNTVGVHATKSDVVVFTNPLKGEEDRVPSSTINFGYSLANTSGVPYTVADIHSHPAWFIEKYLGYHDVFSAADFYCVLAGYSQLAAMFLSGPTRNLAYFRTKETVLAPGHLTREKFIDFWERRGILTSSASMNESICEYHSLALYQGKPGDVLNRIYPQGASR